MGAQEVLFDSGCLVRVVAAPEDAPPGEKFLSWLREEGIDGAIDIDRRWTKELTRPVAAWQFPLISVVEQSPMVESDLVGVDEQAVARLAALHLHALGFRRCGYLLFLSFPYIQKRFEAFRQEAQSLGIWDPKLVLDLRRRYVREPTHTLELARLPKVGRFFRESPKPMAIVTHNDFVAAALVEWLIEQGYEVPRDVAVIGSDNDPLYALSNVGLTTVDISMREIGREAARLLLSRLGGRSTKSCRCILLQPRLIVRASTITPDWNAPWLKTVLDIIEERFDQPFLARELARKVGWREETLERRFHRVMGCTITEYRNRLRLERAAELLREEPHLKIAAIGRRVGFTTHSRFAAQFRKRFGVSPHAYQQRVIAEAVNRTGRAWSDQKSPLVGQFSPRPTC